MKILGTPYAPGPTYKIHIRFFLSQIMFSDIQYHYTETKILGDFVSKLDKSFLQLEKSFLHSAILFVRAFDCGGHKNEDKGNG